MDREADEKARELVDPRIRRVEVTPLVVDDEGTRLDDLFVVPRRLGGLDHLDVQCLERGLDGGRAAAELAGCERRPGGESVRSPDYRFRIVAPSLVHQQVLSRFAESILAQEFEPSDSIIFVDCAQNGLAGHVCEGHESELTR